MVGQSCRQQQSSTETEESTAKLNHVIVAQTLFHTGSWLEADLFQGHLRTHDKSTPWVTLHFIDLALSTERCNVGFLII